MGVKDTSPAPIYKWLTAAALSHEPTPTQALRLFTAQPDKAISTQQIVKHVSKDSVHAEFLIIHLLQRRREVEIPFSMVKFVLLARKRSSRRGLAP